MLYRYHTYPNTIPVLNTAYRGEESIIRSFWYISSRRRQEKSRTALIIDIATIVYTISRLRVALVSSKRAPRPTTAGPSILRVYHPPPRTQQETHNQSLSKGSGYQGKNRARLRSNFTTAVRKRNCNSNGKSLSSSRRRIRRIMRKQQCPLQIGGLLLHRHYSMPIAFLRSSQRDQARTALQVDGVCLRIVCPENSLPGSLIRIEPPPCLPEQELSYQTMMVLVPVGVNPGGQFAFAVGPRQQVLVECPLSFVPGQLVEAKLPTWQIVDHIQITYPNGSGWIRTVRASDLKFQWVRHHESVVVATSATPVKVDKIIKACKTHRCAIDFDAKFIAQHSPRKDMNTLLDRINIT